MTANRTALTPIESAITKREYFAAMAMQGICASPFAPDIKNVSQAMASDVKNAVKMADALLAELEKPHE